MSKVLYYWWIFLFMPSSAVGQNNFSLLLDIDSTVDSKKIICRYDNGKTAIISTDTFSNNSLFISDKYYSEKVSILIQYLPNGKDWYNLDFIIGDIPARIKLSYSPDATGGAFFATSVDNALPISDTSLNPMFKRLSDYRKKEASEISKLWGKYGNMYQVDDSITEIFRKSFKDLDSKTIDFIILHNSEYFSFWWYKNQIINTALDLFSRDKQYLAYLKQTLIDIFPPKYSMGSEGLRLQKQIEKAIQPISVGDTIPQFSFIDITNRRLKSDQIDSRFILFHFWATWCAPCKKQIPQIKELQEAFPQNKDLQIVSICTQSDSKNIKQFIESFDLNAINVIDRDNEIGNLIGIGGLPAIILMDKSGSVLYFHEGLDNLNLIKNILVSIPK